MKCQRCGWTWETTQQVSIKYSLSFEKNTDDSKKEICKILMRSIHIERQNDDSEDILEQWIDFMNRKIKWNDPIPEFEKEVTQIYNICKLKEADTVDYKYYLIRSTIVAMK